MELDWVELAVKFKEQWYPIPDKIQTEDDVWKLVEWVWNEIFEPMLELKE